MRKGQSVRASTGESKIAHNLRRVVSMNFVTKGYVRANELRCKMAKGQTMTEYALIMAAIAVVCIAAYNTLGGKINTEIGSVTSALSAS
jgi:Flp pilus assembly pilin Flp